MQYGIQHHREVSAQAAGAVIINAQQQVLLVQELKGSKRGLWHIPSGSVEAGELPYQTALREIKEETGLDLELGTYLRTYVGQFDDGELVLRHAWLIALAADTDSSLSASKVATSVENQRLAEHTLQAEMRDEIGQVRFFSLAEVEALYQSDQLRMHHTWLMIQDGFQLHQSMAKSHACAP